MYDKRQKYNFLIKQSRKKNTLHNSHPALLTVSNFYYFCRCIFYGWQPAECSVVASFTPKEPYYG